MKLAHFALGLSLLAGSAAHAAVVNVTPSTGAWNAFMNVFELPVNGGGFVFGSGWGISDLNASFNDPAGTLALSPNTVGDANPFWYIGGGAPGAAGNKIMEANLYYETTGVHVGTTLTFEGTVLSNSLTSAHTAVAFIKDFAPDYSTFNITTIPLNPGAFSVSLNTINDPLRHVQWGFQFVGVNVWATDVAPFGNVVIATPTPASAGLLAVGAVFAGRRRRR